MARFDIRRRLRTALFDQKRTAARLDVRGFASTTPDKQRRLESSGGAFLDGYRAAIRAGHPRETSLACEDIEPSLRGFAYEGGAMGLSVLDLAAGRGPRRFDRFLHEYADAHAYMVHVGTGWAISRCPWGVATFLPKLDPVLRWLSVDGMGFHAGFFHPAALFDRRRVPLLRRAEPDAFDTGLGRSLWFVCGAHPDRALQHIDGFPEARRPALWSGLGLAVTYAGGASDDDLQALARDAGPHRAHLAQGAAFAAKARERAGNPAAHTERACVAFCGVSAFDAARMTDRCREGLATGPDTFRRWRELLVGAFTAG